MPKDSNGDYWKYEVDSVQRGGISATVNERKVGPTTVPSAEQDNNSDDDRKVEGGSDEFGIPDWI